MHHGMMDVANMMTITAAACLAVTLGAQPASAQNTRIIKTDRAGRTALMDLKIQFIDRAIPLPQRRW
jgi:negative regulator of sigma E activity